MNFVKKYYKITDEEREKIAKSRRNHEKRFYNIRIRDARGRKVPVYLRSESNFFKTEERATRHFYIHFYSKYYSECNFFLFKGNQEVLELPKVQLIEPLGGSNE